MNFDSNFSVAIKRHWVTIGYVESQLSDDTYFNDFNKMRFICICIIYDMYYIYFRILRMSDVTHFNYFTYVNILHLFTDYT